MRRIASTDRNMERVRDVMATIEEQLGPLSEKAEKTKKYMSLSRTKRDYDGALAFHNYKTSDRLLTRLKMIILHFKDEEIELQTELSKLEAAVIPCNLYQQKSKNSLSCGKLNIRKSSVMKSV